MISDRKLKASTASQPGTRDQENWTPVCVQLQKDKLIELDAHAAKTGVSRQSLIQLAVYRLLEQGRNRSISDLLVFRLENKRRNS
jgi:hypothetical protein